MSKEESYYDILEVSKTATLAELKKKKKELSLKHHPDKLAQDLPQDQRDFSEKMIKKINEAFEVLSDPEKRQLYDKYGKEGLNNQSPFGRGGPFNGGTPFNPFSGFNPEEIFGNMFAGKQQQQQQVKIQPIQIHLDMTFEEIYSGKKYTKEIERTNVCSKCDATGFEDKQKHNCTTCNGKGTRIEINQMGPGMIRQTRSLCNDCNGTGNDKNAPTKCKKCKGDCVIEEKFSVTFDIEPGLRRGDHIIIQGKGNISPKQPDKRGDIIVIINEIEHSIFKRGIVYDGKLNPANLAIEIELELHEALCGFVKKFKHLNGEDIYIDHYNIIKDGDLKVIKDKGFPYKGKKYQNGDLFVKFKIKYPQGMDDNESLKKKLYELLTGTKYDNSKVHKIPKDKHSIQLENIEDYNTDNNSGPAYESDEDGNENENGAEEVQCAQQ